MAGRVIIGRHSSYAYTGVFVSLPGLEVAAQDPTGKAGLALSSQWPQVACVVASGVCSLGGFVPYPGVVSGFRPYVLFNRRISSGYDTHETFTGVSQVMIGQLPFTTQEEHRSRWRCSQGSTGFTIERSSGAYEDTADANASFRYVLFNLDVLG